MTGSQRLRRLLPILLALCLPLAAAPAAVAGEAIKRDRAGDGRFRGLSATERRALDIRRVELAGGSFGLVARVTFGGNLERAIGRRGLRSAAVALVLRPRSRRSRPTVLTTRGAGPVGSTLRRSRSRRVLVIRRGRQFTFVILGSGLRGVRRVALRAIPRVSTRVGGRAAQDAPPDEDPIGPDDYPEPALIPKTLADRLMFATNADELLQDLAADGYIVSDRFGGQGVATLSQFIEGAQAELKQLDDSLMFDDLTDEERADREVITERLRAVIVELQRRRTANTVALIRRACSGPHGGLTSRLRVLIEAIKGAAGLRRSDASGSGGQATVSITGPGAGSVAGVSSRTLALDGNGRGAFDFDIREFGNYTIRSSVRLADGVTKTSTDRLNVRAGQRCRL